MYIGIFQMHLWGSADSNGQSDFCVDFSLWYFDQAIEASSTTSPKIKTYPHCPVFSSS
jgi:hypothetical protein